MKKVTLISIAKQHDSDADLYVVTYMADGEVYHKRNVAISLYGYSFDKETGVDDFNIMMNLVQ